jgi:cobalt-zinc-cadmium efflux system membrane fusion protein
VSLQRLADWLAIPVSDSEGGLGAVAPSSQGTRSPVMSRIAPLLLLVLVSAFIGSWFPQISAPVRGMIASLAGVKTDAPAADPAPKAEDGAVTLTQEQIGAAHIETERVAAGSLTRRIVVPAAVKPDPDRIGRVAAKVSGTIAELRKRLGDPVEKGEVVAIIDSREVADAKSEYIAALANYNLQNLIYQREKGLFDKKIIAEQMFLRTKTTFTQANLRVDLARQKLASLDVSEAEIAALPKQTVSALRRKEITAPISGRVIQRLVNLGQPVVGDGQLYVIADLSIVEADLAVPVADLGSVREGQRVRLKGADGKSFDGSVTFINAMVTPETRSGQVLAMFNNPGFGLHPGTLLNAEIALQRTQVKAKVPRAAVQMIDGEPAVFLRTPRGFVKRDVKTGASDDDSVEIVSGVAPGDTIAVSNTFVLKAELGKNNIPAE